MIQQNEVEMNIENSRLVLTYEAGCLPEYQKKILASGEIPCFLKMGFVNIEGKDVVTYNISGLKSLDKHKFGSFNDMMEVFERVLYNLSYADEYLIDIGYICLDANYIFIDLLRNQLKFLYKPSKVPGTWKHSFRRLVADLNDRLQSRDTKKYFELLIEFIDDNDWNIEDISLKISELKRDAHMCGIR